MIDQWLNWVRRLQAVAQIGLAYATDPFDIERYESIRDIAAEMAAAHTADDFGTIQNLFAHQKGYATPKIDVRGVIICKGKMLLAKERKEGLWAIPGGGADVGESPGQAVEREVYEETGYQVRATRLLAVFDRDHPRHGHSPYPFSVYKLFFQCDLLGGEPTTSLETNGVGFFARDQIPALSPMRVTPSQVDRLFEIHAHPEWPTEFD
jgi:ADP-ribose pyrophosphatase YjhB (NUDIX family)